MRRADRLFELVQLIRGRRVSTAAWLAQRLEVSERTVYRDIADLLASGVPIDGEAGVGYRMHASFDLPPLMFSRLEAQALVAAVRIAAQRLDPVLADHGERALGKILSVLPAEARAQAERLALVAPPIAGPAAQARAMLGVLREATESRRKLAIRYRDANDSVSSRTIRPLATVYWGAVWTLLAWCEQREDFRNFRIDRIESASPGEERFRDEPGRTAADFMRRIGQKPSAP